MGTPEIMAAEAYFTPPDPAEQTTMKPVEKTKVFDCVREHQELATEEFFFCYGHLTTVPVSERSSHDHNHCKQCWKIVGADTNRGFGRQLTVEELNAKYTGDLPSKWLEKQQEHQAGKQVEKKQASRSKKRRVRRK